MSEEIAKPKFPRAIVETVLDEMRRRLDPTPAFSCPNALADRVCAVGGYRRGKAEMKDLELLYIPRIAAAEDPADMFGAKIETNLTEQVIAGMLAAGILTKRTKSTGVISAWGPWNKHAFHVASGLPIDLFASTAENYANRMVVTTGPRELNVRIAITAREDGWEWEVGEGGFVPLGKTWATAPRDRRLMREEADAFRFVKIPFEPPERRR